MKKGLVFLPLLLWRTAQDSDDMQLSWLFEPGWEIKVSSHVSGVVSTVNTERGSQVKKGQVKPGMAVDVAIGGRMGGWADRAA